MPMHSLYKSQNQGLCGNAMGGGQRGKDAINLYNETSVMPLPGYVCMWTPGENGTRCNHVLSEIAFFSAEMLWSESVSLCAKSVKQVIISSGLAHGGM